MAKRKPGQTFGDEIRAAIENCGKTRYQISRETGLDQAALSKFVLGQRGLSLDSLDLLASAIDLHAVLGTPQAKGGR